MEVHPRANSVLVKRIWNVLRVAFFMIRKGLISKRKLIMDMNLMMKRGKLLRKSVRNLIASLPHHHHSRNYMAGGLREYEFSCSNSPNPVFSHLPNKRKLPHHYFPCINLPQVEEEEEDGSDQSNDIYKAAVVMVPKTPEYTFNIRLDHASDFAVASPLLSPFAVRVSNYSSEDENENENGGNYNGQVDDDAEEFIKSFYEQLRAQSRMQLLQYN